MPYCGRGVFVNPSSSVFKPPEDRCASLRGLLLLHRRTELLLALLKDDAPGLAAVAADKEEAIAARLLEGLEEGDRLLPLARGRRDGPLRAARALAKGCLLTSKIVIDVSTQYTCLGAAFIEMLFVVVGR